MFGNGIEPLHLDFQPNALPLSYPNSKLKNQKYFQKFFGEQWESNPYT